MKKFALLAVSLWAASASAQTVVAPRAPNNPSSTAPTFNALTTNGLATLNSLYSYKGTIANTNPINTNLNLVSNYAAATRVAPQLLLEGNVGGTTTSGNTSLVSASFNDAINTTIKDGVGQSGVQAFYFNHYMGSGSVTGGRIAMNLGLEVAHQTGSKAAGLPVSSANYTAFSVSANASANDGGTGTGVGQTYGSLWAANPIAQLLAGATNWNSLVNHEFDVAVEAGASVANKAGLTIVLNNNDAAQGSYDDAAIIFGAQGATTTPGWKNLIEIGGAGGVNPLDLTGGRVMYFNPNTSGFRAHTALDGINLTGLTFSGSAFSSTGFAVDGSGAVTAAAYKSGAAAGVSCAAGTVNLSTLVITNGIVTHC